MTPRKLSDSDKQQILELYRQPGETTSTLANRYGVSNSTISRLLKNNFSEAEYEGLIQQKRSRSTSDLSTSDRSTQDTQLQIESEPELQVELELQIEPGLQVEPEPQTELVESVENFVETDSLPEPSNEQPEVEASSTPIRRSRRRSSASTESDAQADVEAPPEREPPAKPTPKPALKKVEPLQAVDLPMAELAPVAAELNGAALSSPSHADYSPEATAVKEIIGESLLDQEEDLTGLDEDLDDDFDDDDDGDDDGELEQGALLVGSREGKAQVQVLPLTDASIPRTCYLVVDRSAELVARPLKEFGDLGQIPEAEIQEKTLPVFDNHRVAKRYSNPRTQRVIKLPDGKILRKTSLHLQAKGITRLLIDGQVYSLEGDD